ncbi:tetratricopeptide repeat protein [Hydromonas duriensis]|uniref:Tetratricopeptide repeat protein n=1 Tax=Hydromonas duriensis TaxID=1527608 RepID=A0A4R6YAD4_9BURK|nr:tetratricopeptide repeat protein [Hydromonas duriensis]TDR32508.1 tetratricopeptide repeat protein [Hydromonas duriensis]
MQVKNSGLKNVTLIIFLVAALLGCGKTENKPPSTAGKTSELVFVKYQGMVDVSRMQCETITRSSFINRLCYDAIERYTVVLLQNEYYHYCGVPSNIISNWREADSMGRFYGKNIKSNFDCRLSTPPAYAFNNKSNPSMVNNTPAENFKSTPEYIPIAPASSTPEPLIQQETAPLNSVDARSLNADGIRLSKQGNIEQALLAFERAAQLNPNDGEILGNLAYSHYQQGHYEASEQVLYRALSIKPKRGASWILMGQLRSVRGDLNGAVEALDKYLYFSSRKNAAVEQLVGWANGYGDGANIPVLRQAAAQSLANAGY